MCVCSATRICWRSTRRRVRIVVLTQCKRPPLLSATLWRSCNIERLSCNASSGKHPRWSFHDRKRPHTCTRHTHTHKRRRAIAGASTDLRSERGERLDEHGRLQRHVQTSGDAGALQRLGGAVHLPHLHQARHLVLGDVDGLAPPLGQADVSWGTERGGVKIKVSGSSHPHM